MPFLGALPFCRPQAPDVWKILAPEVRPDDLSVYVRDGDFQKGDSSVVAAVIESRRVRQESGGSLAGQEGWLPEPDPVAQARLEAMI